MLAEVWPGWQTTQILGRGSSGTVYKVERTILDEKEAAAVKVISIPQNQYAIEQLRQDGFDDKSIADHFAEQRARIISEYITMKKLKGASNIVIADEVESKPHEDGIGWDVFIKMELLTPLRELLKTEYDSFTEDRIIQLGLDICNALICCSASKLIHRDIKPDNIFVSKYGSFKLGDFGVAKEATGTVAGTKTGTYNFMAPEVFNNDPYGYKADQYSLGLVLYWLLNDRRGPFLPTDRMPTASEEDNARERRYRGESLPPPKRGSHQLREIVLKACAPDPRERFKNAREMRVALGQLIGVSEEFYDEIEEELISDPEEDTVGFWNHHGDQNDETIGVWGGQGKELESDRDDDKDNRKKIIKRAIAIAGAVLVIGMLAFILSRINYSVLFSEDKDKNNTSASSNDGQPDESIIDSLFDEYNSEVEEYNNSYLQESEIYERYTIANPVYSSWEITDKSDTWSTGKESWTITAHRETPFLITNEVIEIPMNYSAESGWSIDEEKTIPDMIQSISLDWEKLSGKTFRGISTADMGSSNGYFDASCYFIFAGNSEDEISVSFTNYNSTESRLLSVDATDKYDPRYNLSNYQDCRNDIQRSINIANAALENVMRKKDMAIRENYAPIGPTSLFTLSECFVNCGYNDVQDPVGVTLTAHMVEWGNTSALNNNIDFLFLNTMRAYAVDNQ